MFANFYVKIIFDIFLLSETFHHIVSIAIFCISLLDSKNFYFIFNIGK